MSDCLRDVHVPHLPKSNVLDLQHNVVLESLDAILDTPTLKIKNPTINDRCTYLSTSVPPFVGVKPREEDSFNGITD